MTYRVSTDLLHEGLWTNDNRMVLPGATIWDPDPDAVWPIIWQPGTGHDAEQIGEIVRLHREGWAIEAAAEFRGGLPTAVCDMLDDRSLRLQADLTLVEHEWQTATVMVDGRLKITAAVVIGATVQDPPRPAWPDLRFALFPLGWPG